MEPGDAKARDRTSSGSQGMLHHTVISEAEVVAVTDDNMVKHLDSQHFTCLDQAPREQDVLLARLDIAARVIVDKDDCRG